MPPSAATNLPAMPRPIIKLRKKIDPWIPILGLVLSLFGLVMILSASQVSAAEQYGNAYFFFIRQLISWGIGIAALVYFMRVDIERLFAWRTGFLVATLVLLVLVFAPVIGPKIANVHRWIDLGFFRLQSAEVAKLFLTIYFSAWLAIKGEFINHPFKGFLPFVAILAVTAGLVVLEPDLGTAIVIVAVAMTIFFAAKAHLVQFIGLALIGILAVYILIHIAPYRADRLKAFLNRGSETSDNLGSGYHGQQALIAIGSGGLWGVGFGQGISKYQYLPESHTDSIFAVVAEELGFVRTAIVLFAYIILLWRGMIIAARANSRFVQLLAVGLTTAIVIQVFINIGGLLNVLPLTGIPLPFISYGGSSLIVSLAMLGLLTNISRETT